jgi:hypothetical protein
MVRSLHDPVNAFEEQGVGRLTTRVAAAAVRERPGEEIRARTGRNLSDQSLVAVGRLRHGGSRTLMKITVRPESKPAMPGSGDFALDSGVPLDNIKPYG